MFGINDNLKRESRIRRIESVLDREKTFTSLGHLVTAMQRKELSNNPDLKKIAIGIDSSAFLKLASHKNSADIIDYLKTQHIAPLILPGQAIQEFWNNHLTAIQTLSFKFKSKLETFKKEILELSSEFDEFSNEIETLVNKFEKDHGFIYDQKSIHNITSMLTALEEKAFVPYVPRTRFEKIARNRKLTKTPPGFQDTGDGDFFIWVEFLYGLLEAKDKKNDFTHAVLLTFDKKKDWSRDKISHPVLSAEIQELIGVPIEFWDLDQFIKAFEPYSETI